MKEDQQQDSEFESTHNSVISQQKTEETSQIVDKLESKSAQESVILEQKTLQNPEIGADNTATYVAKTDRIRALSQFIKTISPYLWAIIIVVVIIPLLGRGFIANSYHQDIATSGNSKPARVIIDKQSDWNKVDESIVAAIKNANTTAENFASAKLDDWVDELMINVDESFLDWYFNYFNQKKLEFSVPFVWASSAVTHWVDSDKPSPDQVVAEKITEDFQLEFAKRVLKPKIAQFALERITTDTVKVYVSQLEKNISSIESSYNIPQGQWERYLNEIAITISESEGVISNLTLKTLVGGGSYLFVKAAIPMGVKIGSQIAAKFAGKAGAKIAAKTGGAIAGKIGAELLDPIVGIGIIIWDLWDYNNTVSVNRPILRNSILEYLHEVKTSLLENPANGIMASIDELQSGILKSVQSAKHPG
ncbi:hypothetical protein [Anabaena catenula]|uniref:hypothetical protein n=1 Tax=Anabaena catenula TaxID=1296320 RepID=UPI0018EF6BFC|nr:hypothetical protein [Anabaena catenula]